MIFGSKAFVNEVFVNHREHFSAKRKDGARRMRWGDWGDLWTVRDLQVDVISNDVECGISHVQQTSGDVDH
jgi:hypothetical protein